MDNGDEVWEDWRTSLEAIQLELTETFAFRRQYREFMVYKRRQRGEPALHTPCEDHEEAEEERARVEPVLTAGEPYPSLHVQQPRGLPKAEGTTQGGLQIPVLEGLVEQRQPEYGQPPCCARADGLPCATADLIVAAQMPHNYQHLAALVGSA